MTSTVPKPLVVEHKALHEALKQATREPGPIGEAAKRVAQRLHPHFVKEEEYALPPLGLAAALARGEMPQGAEEALAMTDRLKRELPEMLAEHARIVEALRDLAAAAREANRAEYVEFAEQLVLHAQTEEEVLYPAALLVGEVIRARRAA
jgi:hypothetical protein